ncbi:MAG: M48 family metallopeptidase [Bacteroidales bacterium]|jgi:STE24 endopeptidase|nr:M48 family metallopeptidase [Bacteroidales bacterium]
MMHQTLFYIIVGILIVDYILDQWLNYLNATHRNVKLPKELTGIYNKEKYRQSQEYEKANHRFSVVTSTVNLLILLGFLFLSGFAWVDEIARSVTSNSVLTALVFFGIIMFASDIINTPFSIYDTFVIEEKFGFNKTTPGLFVTDKLKSWFIMAVLGGGLLALIIWFYQQTGPVFWIYGWLAVSLFMIFMTMFYTSLLLPLFNKLRPLEDGELKKQITQFCEKVDFRLENVYIMDGSKRSSKANAFFSGLGKKKKIVLFDTLIDKLSPEEIVAVLAHEIGHYKKKHTFMAVFASILQTGITFYILSLFINNPVLSRALGAHEASFHLGLVAFGFLYSPISTLTGLFMNRVSRKNEYAADRFAALHFDGRLLQDALKNLSVNNLSNLTPHPVYVFVHYSHPPLLKRLQFIEQVNRKLL